MWNFPLLPDQASTEAQQLDALFLFELVIAGFFTTLIFILIVSFAVRYRRGARADRSNPPVANRGMEIVWVGVPLLIGLVMFAWGAILFYRLYDPPAGALEVYVVGKQWMWKVQHSEGRAEINELHVPLGRPIKLTMTSEDVIHSFYIPAFRVKQDVLPGRRTSMWFRPTRVGAIICSAPSIAGRTTRPWGGGSTSWNRPTFSSGSPRRRPAHRWPIRANACSSSTIAPVAI